MRFVSQASMLLLMP